MTIEYNPKGKSFISWIGGKSLLAKQIVPLMPEHTCYCEVFAGAGWVLFRKSPSQAEVINDINRDLVTLYRVIKHHMDEFVRYFRWILVARDEFERFKAENPDSLTDIQRAVRFFYLVKTSHGSRTAKPTFGTSTTSPPRINLLRLEEDLSAAHLRLARVVVENLHYSAFIERYDREHTFFYLDPPYFECEDYYGKGIFGRDDFGRLRDQLSGIKGRFLMSINDTLRSGRCSAGLRSGRLPPAIRSAQPPEVSRSPNC
jgi:DNA adenine methylase